MSTIESSYHGLAFDLSYNCFNVSTLADLPTFCNTHADQCTFLPQWDCSGHGAPPSPPLAVAATAAVRAAVVTWEAPAASRPPVVQYTLTALSAADGSNVTLVTAGNVTSAVVDKLSTTIDYVFPPPPLSCTDSGYCPRRAR